MGTMCLKYDPSDPKIQKSRPPKSCSASQWIIDIDPWIPVHLTYNMHLTSYAT